jgi:hypothetical protein
MIAVGIAEDEEAVLSRTVLADAAHKLDPVRLQVLGRFFDLRERTELVREMLEPRS